MNKIRIITATLMVTLLGSACVAKSTYELAQVELAEAQSQIQNLEDQQNSLQSMVDELQSELEEIKASNEALQSEITSGKESNAFLKEELETSQEEAETAQTEIGSLQTEVTAATCWAVSYQGNIDEAEQYLDVLDQFYIVVPDDADDLWFTEYVGELYTRVSQTEDPKLESELMKYFESDDSSALDVFTTYVLQKVRDNLEADNSCPESAEIAAGSQ